MKILHKLAATTIVLYTVHNEWICQIYLSLRFSFMPIDVNGIKNYFFSRSVTSVANSKHGNQIDWSDRRWLLFLMNRKQMRLVNATDWMGTNKLNELWCIVMTATSNHIFKCAKQIRKRCRQYDVWPNIRLWTYFPSARPNVYCVRCRLISNVKTYFWQ